MNLFRRVDNFFRKFRSLPPSDSPESVAGEDFQLYSYTNPGGEFDYGRYREVQEQGNQAKIQKTWVLEENIVFLSQYLKRELRDPQFGICHGTRRGNEQLWFREQLSCEVIGTEISATANEFPHTVQWDFHQENPEWTGKADFIYSNSLDHSYDPETCLKTWMRTLKPGGLCILEHSNLHGAEKVTERDPFGVSVKYLPYLIALWGQDQFYLKELIPAPAKDENLQHLVFFIIQKR